MSQPHREVNAEGRQQSMYPLREVKPEADEQAVIAEIDRHGAARIRKCPPGVVVMVVEGFPGEVPEEVSPTPADQGEQRKRSIGAGKRGAANCGYDLQDRRGMEPREIPVEFPG